MRPLLLQMQAFGPFANAQTVNFQELEDRSLFLIAGPTGAGKTTILDAICYALYGESSGAEREGPQLRSDFAPPSLPTEVTFTFQNGSQRYRITRAPKQHLAKKRGTGTTERPAAAELVEVDPSDDQPIRVLAAKVQDCRPAVEEVLGLNGDQFRQVIVIPQGRFRDLLTAKTEDRERIFQSLFSTGRYRTILERLKQQAREIQEEVKTNRARHATVLEQSGSENLEELSAILKTEKASLQSLERKRETAGKTVRQAQQRLSLTRSLSQTRQTFQSIQDESNQANADRKLLKAKLKEASSTLTKEEEGEPERAKLRKEQARLEGLLPQWEKFQQALQEGETARQEISRLTEQSQRTGQSVEKTTQEEKSLQEQAAKLSELAAREGERKLLTEQAAQALKDRKEFDRLTAELKSLSSQLAKARKLGQEKRTAAEKAQQNLSLLQQQRHDGRAALLAAELEPGNPCPVCGSEHHPSPAASDNPLPDEAQLEAAEQTRQQTQTLLEQAREEYSRLKAKADALQERHDEAGAAAGSTSLQDLTGTMNQRQAAWKEAQEAATKITQLTLTQKTLTEKLDALKQEQKKLETDLQAGKTRLATATSRQETLTDQLSESHRKPGQLEKDLAQLNRQLSEAEARLQRAREARQGAETSLAKGDSHLQALQKQIADLTLEYRSSREELLVQMNGEVWRQISRDAPPEAPDLPYDWNDFLDQLSTQEQTAEEALADLNAQLGSLQERLSTRASQQKQLKQLEASFERLEADYRTTGRLAEVADGKNAHRLTFPRFVLGAILDDVLRAATLRLHGMSRGRFELYRSRESRRAGGLDLEVMDHHTGIARPVATLSGGESFLASLSLALGLADVTESYAGGIRMETIFIDEGFGSLDADALDLAFRTLFDLQKGGRLVGVISHVADLKERIDTRLEIISSPTGSQARFVL